MIGVIADSADDAVIREFFELFKTPWEFYSPHRKYEVVLCEGTSRTIENAKVVLHYSGKAIERDDQGDAHIFRNQNGFRVYLYCGNRIPIYGDATTFFTCTRTFLIDEDSEQCAAYLDNSRGPTAVRIGYDLFHEVRTLLTVGQPPVNAAIPTLDLHITLLRDIITGCGISLVEIPPIPVGYSCIACLTHDVDHPSIRQHRWDRTMLGFLYRAIVGSLPNLVRGRISASNFLANWAAVLKLPFVYLGLAKDFWREFDDSYLKLESGLHSTFFVIPFNGRPGKTIDGPGPQIRGAAYRAQDIAESIRKLEEANCEIGLHGIDAWIDCDKGREELDEIRHLTKSSDIGVRMHWLYYDNNSAALLEAADAAYDSTVGYNETVGYRAGTTQVYKPLQVSRLLELPLHVMDTALFFSSYLNLSPRRARVVLRQMVDNAIHFGGTLTTNWHDRSLAPERLWGECYRELIEDLKKRGAWFATAAQAINWFRKRRAVVFETGFIESGEAHPKIAVEPDYDLPGMRLRIHRACQLIGNSANRSEDYVDTAVAQTVETGFPCKPGK
jgi:hypothetical protein